MCYNLHTYKNREASMNNYSKLIQSNLISFKDALLENYKQIGLNEVETIIIMHLYDDKSKNNEMLSVSSLKQKMTISESILSKMIVNLVEKGMIELTYEANDVNRVPTEKFSLNPIIEKLGDVLDKEKAEPIKHDRALAVSNITQMVEERFQRMLSLSDLELINIWLDENVTYDEIDTAVLETIKNGKNSLKYTDAIINSRKRAKERKACVVNPEIKEVLDLFNVKK